MEWHRELCIEKNMARDTAAAIIQNNSKNYDTLLLLLFYQSDMLGPFILT